MNSNLFNTNNHNSTPIIFSNILGSLIIDFNHISINLPLVHKLGLKIISNMNMILVIPNNFGCSLILQC